MSVATILGVDGGGTKTAARVALSSPDGPSDAGPLCLIGVGEAGGSNPYSVGWDAAERSIRDAIDAAVRDAGGEGDLVVGAAVIAVAGAATDEARDRLAGWARDAGIARRVDVVADTLPILAEAPAGRSAIGLIAGTGSSAVTLGPAGEPLLLGGWGYLIDDAGSGFAIGQTALRLAVRAADRGEPFALGDAALRTLGLDRLAELKPAVYQAADPRGVIASLAPTVLDLAQRGDEAAAGIVRSGADALAGLVADAARRPGVAEGPPVVCVAGSLLQRSPAYRAALRTSLAQRGVEAELRLAPEPACGCLRLAQRLLRN
ncbi:MAG: BadF/BadG/BcrA/BcrD ATPase family protein [Planctomycetota bacterium]